MTTPNTGTSPAVGVSVSESPDLRALGLSEGHLRDAMAEIALHVLASGRSLAYGGDLRRHGFTEFLAELVARYRSHPRHGGTIFVTDYLAWPVHIRMASDEITAFSAEHEPGARLVFLALDGARLEREQRLKLCAHVAGRRGMGRGLDRDANCHAGGHSGADRSRRQDRGLPGSDARDRRGGMALSRSRPARLPLGRVRRVHARHRGDSRPRRALGRLTRWVERTRALPQVRTGQPPQWAIPRRERRPGPDATYP